MPMNPHPTSFGVFKPVGHVLLAFADDGEAEHALSALATAGFKAGDVHHYTPEQMREQAEGDIGKANTLANLGQDLNLVKAHLGLARQGHSFIVVRTADDDAVSRVTDVAARSNASRAQHYGTMIVEELIPPGGNAHQVAESPDRGLDTER